MITLKNISNLFTTALFIVFLSACGNKKQEAINAPEGMSVLDLSKYGKPFTIFVPDTLATKPEITEQSSGALEIKSGKNFAISINEQAADIEMKKQDVKSDEINKLKNFITDEPTAILWESEITKSEFHFLVNQKIGNTDYSFSEINDSDANPFGKDAIQKMFDAAKNTKPISREK